MWLFKRKANFFDELPWLFVEAGWLQSGRTGLLLNQTVEHGLSVAQTEKDLGVHENVLCNHCSFKYFSLNLPLKLSMQTF